MNKLDWQVVLNDRHFQGFESQASAETFASILPKAEGDILKVEQIHDPAYYSEQGRKHIQSIAEEAERRAQAEPKYEYQRVPGVEYPNGWSPDYILSPNFDREARAVILQERWRRRKLWYRLWRKYTYDPLRNASRLPRLYKYAWPWILLTTLLCYVFADEIAKWL